LLPEGANLDTLLRIEKIDKNDLFEILMTVGRDTVGAVTVIEANNEEMSDNI
jgi:HipA-like protein